MLKNVFLGPNKEVIYYKTLYVDPNHFECTFFERSRFVVGCYSSCIVCFDFLCTFYGDMYKIFPI